MPQVEDPNAYIAPLPRNPQPDDPSPLEIAARLMAERDKTGYQQPSKLLRLFSGAIQDNGPDSTLEYEIHVVPAFWVITLTMAQAGGPGSCTVKISQNGGGYILEQLETAGLALPDRVRRVLPGTAREINLQIVGAYPSDGGVYVNVAACAGYDPQHIL
jgi:hypothetical protein